MGPLILRKAEQAANENPVIFMLAGVERGQRL
jgi:hypothetical protein